LKNILIIGGAGYIGRQIVNLLNKKKYKIFVIDNLSTTKKNYLNKKINFFKVSILNKNKLKKLFKKYHFNTVIHLAAKCVVSESEKYPQKYYATNVIGTKNIIECSKKYRVQNFIFSSSCSVFSNKTKIVKENSSKNPISYYGKTKLIAEKLIKKKFNKSNIKYIILRYFNVVGADKKNKIGEIGNKDRLFNNISKKIIGNEKNINIYGGDYKTNDGTCIRDYIHVYDLANIHIKCLEKIKKIKKSTDLNCSYGKGYSVLEIAKTFQKLFNKKIKISFRKRRIGDMKEIVASNKKLNKFINWTPKFNNLNKMVKSTFTWNRYLDKIL
tara:strand:- start:1812 stop:2792 length:981 start_codon:yes stop_codon:yes gene_type:complete